MIGLGGLLAWAGCTVGPSYKKPSVETPGAYKEAAEGNKGSTNVWKLARPSDDLIRGKWWESFDDPLLNSLEDQVTISNQNVAAAFANFLAARAIVHESRAQLFPTVSGSPSVTRSKQGGLGGFAGASHSPFTEYNLPFDASWQLDLWGRIRNTIKANAASAQASAADLENVRLSAQAELAADYFQLRAQDTLAKLFQETVAAYQESFNLTQVRFKTGIASDEDVSQAETQLKTAQAEATNVGILRAQLEHAIALLIGRPASEVSIPPAPLKPNPPVVPAALPSQLLERRPDIAAAERQVAAANAQIGVAKAAYFPSVTLTGSGGFESTSISSLFNGPSAFWSIGGSLAQTLFDAGLRRATVQQFKAAYQGAVANYRQTVLTAFQQVENELSSLRILELELQQQEDAVNASQRFLALSLNRYKLGIDSYLNVITAQTAYLSNRQTLVNLQSERMSATVQLIENLGGGWDDSRLPTTKNLVIGKEPKPPT